MNYLPSNTLHPDEVIRSLCSREGDTMERNFFKYRETVRDVYNDLNLSVIKYTKRVLLPVNKNTNSIILPDDYFKLSSISRINECNMIIPLAINTNIVRDLVDISAEKNCGCECGCKSSLCGVIKNYEAITEDTYETMPDASSKKFTSITRKIAYPDGSVVMERTYPVKKLVDGTFTDVILQTDKTQICKLDVQPCGCIVNTPANVDKVNSCCNGASYTVDWGCTVCDVTPPDGYNFSEIGNTINLPSNYCSDKVLVRYYFDVLIKDMRIPRLAKDAFMAGMKAKTAMYDDTVQEYRVRRYNTTYANLTEKLSIDLNKYSLHEIYKVLTPKRVMP